MLNLSFPNFPELQTERLLLRQLKAEDAQSIHELRSDPAINCYLDRAISTGIADAQAYIEKIDQVIQTQQGFYWVITLKSDDGLIGTICFWNFNIDKKTIEMGYELTTAHQGQGILTEAAREVIEFAFTAINTKVITAFPSVNNEKSVALLERLGFKVADFDIETDHDVDGMVKYVLTK